MKVMKKLLIGAVCVLTFAVAAYATNEGEDNDQNDGLNHEIVNMDNNERELDTWNIEINLQIQMLQDRMLQAIEQGNLDLVRNLYDQGRELMNRDPYASAIPDNWYSSWINYLNIARENDNEHAAYELINFLLNNNANIRNIFDYYDFSSDRRRIMDDKLIPYPVREILLGI